MSETINTGIGTEAGGTSNALEGHKAGIIAAVEAELERIRKDAETESARIIAEAKQLAQNITSQAEEKSNQEAREKTRHEVEQIMFTAENESAEILTGARQDALAQANKIAADAKEAAERTAKTLLDEAAKAADETARAASELKRKAEQEAVETRDRAIHEAEQIIKDSLDSARTRVAEKENTIVAEAKRQGEKIVDQASGEARSTLQEAATAVHEAVQKLSGRIRAIKEKAQEQPGQENKAGPQSIVSQENQPPPGPASVSAPVATPAGEDLSAAVARQNAQSLELLLEPVSIEQVLDSDMMFDGGENAVLYIGEVELHVVTPADVDRLSEFIECLKKVPHLQIQRSDCEVPEGVKITVVIDAAVHLFEIVRRLTPVEEAEQIGKDILIKLLPARKGTKKGAAGSPDNA